MSAVQGAVAAALRALTEAGEAFRMAETACQSKAAAMVGTEAQRELVEKAIENGRLAQMCGSAAVALDGALEDALEGILKREAPKARVPEAYEGFMAGWRAQAHSYEWIRAEESGDRPQGTQPAHTLDAALAVYRAQMAKGVA